MQDNRCVMILNSSLAPGKAANAAAVMALTLGQRHPAFVGSELEDAHARRFPGLIPTGIPVLAADSAALGTLWAQCSESGFDVVVFPQEGQTTTDYLAFAAAMQQQPAAAWRLLGIAVVGEKKSLRKLTSRLSLFS